MVNPFAFGRDQFDPSNRFVTSWLLPPWVLFALRFLFGLYAFVTQFVSIGTQVARGNPGQATAEFSYFTVLTYWGIAFYLLVASLHTATYAATGRSLLSRLPRPLQALHSLFYSSICVFPLIVTIVYWAVLYSGPWFNTTFAAWSNVSRHAMNSGFALFEMLLARTDLPPWIHMLWLIVLLALYLSLAYLTRATRGFYVYPFLDPANGKGKVAAYIFGIAVGCIVFFLLVVGIIWLRRWITETKLHKHGKRSPKEQMPPADLEGDASGIGRVKYDR